MHVYFFFFKDTATTEIYTRRSSAASDVYKRQERFWPLTTRLPAVGRSIEAINLTKVVLPAPEWPVMKTIWPVSYTHLRAHETVLDLVCRLLLEKKTTKKENINGKKILINK